MDKSSGSSPSSKSIAPGKIILTGEHAVVYGQPAIAVPVWEATAQATVTSMTNGFGCQIVAHDLNLTIPLSHADADDPLALIVRNTLGYIGYPAEPDWRIDLSSTIPIASGLGSGAAVSAAIIRAICQHTDYAIDDAAVSQLIYQSEMLHHGTPSGIDNTVIAYGMPVWYIKGKPPIPFERAKSLTIIIGDSGIVAPTKESVGDVRQGWKDAPRKYEEIFEQIGALTWKARQCIESGKLDELGVLFDQNHRLLKQLNVSHPKLEQMVAAARAHGALGAKLSGGGRGGNMIALVQESDVAAINKAILAAGANRVISTVV